MLHRVWKYHKFLRKTKVVASFTHVRWTPNPDWSLLLQIKTNAFSVFSKICLRNFMIFFLKWTTHLEKKLSQRRYLFSFIENLQHCESFTFQSWQPNVVMRLNQRPVNIVWLKYFSDNINKSKRLLVIFLERHLAYSNNVL